ncbi:hypothetical protein B0H11DRAFT_2213982 [Mycena galericulata]|nr:hypothetical protein B0H11DRAFT_2213982 [Mycena galericulata]
MYDRHRKPHRARHHATGIFHQQAVLQGPWCCADEWTIKKAFEHTAKSAHPDKGGTEQKRVALNEAYEMLCNPDGLPPYPPGEECLFYVLVLIQII